MAVIEIAKILVRRGREKQTGIPQLDSGEFGWAEDTENLFIGKRIVDGAASDQNTRILTERDLDNIFDLIGTIQKNNEEDNATYYRYRSDAPWIHSSGTTVQNKLDQYVSLADYGVISSSGVTNVTYWENSLDNFVNITPAKTINLTLSNSYIDSVEASAFGLASGQFSGIVLVITVNILTNSPITFGKPVITVGNPDDYLIASTKDSGIREVTQGTLSSSVCKTIIGFVPVPKTGLSSADLKLQWPDLPLNELGVSTAITVDACVFYNVSSNVLDFASGFSTSTTSTSSLVTPIGPLTAPVGSVIVTSFIEYCGTPENGDGPNDISVDSANNEYPYNPSLYYVLNGANGLPLSIGTDASGLFYTTAYRSNLEREIIVGNKDYTSGIELNFNSGIAFVLPPVADYLKPMEDITDRLQLAIDDLFSNITAGKESRRELLIPAGSYSISRTIDIPSYTILKGVGPGITNIYLTNNAPVMFRTVGVDSAGVKYNWSTGLGNQSAAVRPQNIRIENMSLMHTSSLPILSTATSMISIDNAREVTLKNIKINNNNGINQCIGVNIRGQGGDFSYTRINDGYTQNVTITDCEFQNLEIAVECTGTVIRPFISNSIFSYLDHGIRFYTIDNLPGPSDGFITKNRFQNIVYRGISVGANPNDFRSNISSTENFFGQVGNGTTYKDYITTITQLQSTSVIDFGGPGNKTTNDYFTRKSMAEQGAGLSIESIELSEASKGPYTNPKINISSPNVPNGKQAIAELDWNEETQLINSVYMVEKGYGYTSVPTITITAETVGTVSVESTVTVSNNFYYVPYVSGIATIQDLATYSTTIDTLSTATFARFPITGGTQRIDILYQIVSSSLNRVGTVVLSLGYGGSTLIDEVYNFNLDLVTVSNGLITPLNSGDPQTLVFPQAGNDWVMDIPLPTDTYYIVGYGQYDGFAVSIASIDVRNVNGVDCWAIGTLETDFDLSDITNVFTVGYLDYYMPEISFSVSNYHNYVELQCYNDSTSTSVVLEYQANVQLLSLPE